MDVSIHLVFSIYNKLFNHLKTSITVLESKKVAWKQLILALLKASKAKLLYYYSMTNKINNNLYIIGIILSLQQKLQFFKRMDWHDPDTDWYATYYKSIKDYFDVYKQKLSVL